MREKLFTLSRTQREDMWRRFKSTARLELTHQFCGTNQSGRFRAAAHSIGYCGLHLPRCDESAGRMERGGRAPLTDHRPPQNKRPSHYAGALVVGSAVAI